MNNLVFFKGVFIAQMDWHIFMKGQGATINLFFERMKLSIIEGGLPIVNGEQIEGEKSNFFVFIILLLVGGASIFISRQFTIAHTLYKLTI